MLPRMNMFMGLRLLVTLLSLITLTSASNITTKIVTTLPGYSGDLPFTMETGYIGVGDNEEVQLFYVFVESQRSPAQDPLVLRFGAGPGCSGLHGFFFENGPLSFNSAHYNGSLPTLEDNPYSWTEALNIIFLDAPAGAGFSYSTTQEGYYVDEYKYAEQGYEFLQKWLEAHPAYVENQLYISGESFSGLIVPMIVQKIVDGNENGSVPLMNIKGYLLQNPVTDSVIDGNAIIPYVHRQTLVSDQLYEAAKTSCNGEYVNVNSSNAACIADIEAIDQLIKDINYVNILEPDCSTSLPRSKKISTARRYLKELYKGLLSSPTNGPALWCREYNYMLLYIWANTKAVRDALGVRTGTKLLWKPCNTTLTGYTYVVTSSLSYHLNLSKKADLRALIYSGDHDMSVPHIGTQAWINLLHLTVDESWRTWSLDGQTKGYTKKLINDYITLIFATVKGAGHLAAEYQPKEVASLVGRWMAYYPV
ncbi:hypothetical protein ACLB2K_038214 [Fragaria x ananassa]